MNYNTFYLKFKTMKKLYAIPSSISRFVELSKLFVLPVLLTIFAMGSIKAQITVEKKIVTVSPASSGVSGHIDVKYEITLTNNTGVAVNGGQLGDQLDDALNLNSAFVQVLGVLPVTLEGATGLASATLNNNFDGLTAGDPAIANPIDMPNGSSITFSFVVELNPTAAATPGDLSNTAVYLDGAAVPVNSNPAVLPDCWTNCVMACNTLVNISANSNCEVEVLSQAVLEGEDQTCAAMGFYSVKITDANGNPVPSPIGKAYIGQKLTATVTNIACGNSCWGQVLIEDKRAPELTCKDTLIRCNQDIDPLNLGFPVPLADILNPNGPQPYIAMGIDACGNVTLTYTDSIVDQGCGSDTSSIIYRKWKAIDDANLMAMCFDTIYLQTGTLADIDLPPHYDGISINPDGDAPEPILPACNGTWTKFPNGFPDTTATGTGAPKGILCGKIQFFFEDDTIEICGNGFKLLRHWIIVDWCHPQDRLEYIQRIKIADLDPPVLSCPGTRFVAADTISTGLWSCTAEYLLPVPQNIENLPAPDPHGVYVIGECSKWTYEVSHLAAINPNDCTPDPGAIPTKDNIVQIGTTPGGLPIFKVINLPLGCNWIYYTVTDDCGHVTSCAYDIYVRDDIKPTVACDKHTVVSLTDDVTGGLVQVPASVFDDGSFDNCMLDTMLVRRTSDNCRVRNNTRFRGYTEFCCNDIGKEIEVILKVIDKAGNMSQCTVKVTVQDKLPPIITSCPKDTTVDCGIDLSGNLNKRFGTVTWLDNCGATVSDKLYGSVNSCGVGTYTRVFTVTDKGGLKATCSQRIRVVNQHPVTRKDIKFPKDTLLTNVCQGDLSPDRLGKPIYPPFDKCTQLAASYEDRVFSFVDGACFKILRVWSVLNWCTKEEWDTVQVIKIINTIKPEIIGCTSKVFDIVDSTCSKTITLSVDGRDDCTPVNDLKWSYIFKRSDGTTYTGNRNSATFTRVPKGIHTMTWTLEDQCGNVTKCTQRIVVRDKKKPTPYCRTGIVTVLMEGSKQIAIWANDFNIGSFDNCTSDGNLKYSFSADTADRGKIFTCSDLGPNGADSLHTVQMWVTDEAGNQDYCEVKVLLQDNSGVCGGNTNLKGIIAGRVMMSDETAIENAEVSLTNSSIDLIDKKMTLQTGAFKFEVPMHESYALKVTKNGAYIKGVSTRDLVIIQKHLLGMEVFDSPYQFIAADANNSHTISSSDIVTIRRLILGKSDKFAKSPSWRFVDKDYTYPDPFSPWPIKESISISEMDKDMMGNHFMAIKIGDLTGDGAFDLNGANKTRSAEELTLFTNGHILNPGDEYQIPVYSESRVSLEGIQLTIQLPEACEFVGITSGVLSLSEENLGLQNLNQGIVTMSWYEIGGKDLQTNEPLFYIHVKAKANTSLQGLAMNSDVTTMEAFDKEGKDFKVKWELRTSKQKSASFALLQNTPNPFNHTTTIGFVLPEASGASLTVFDMSGKVVRQMTGQYQKGYNEIVLDMKDHNKSGVLYYRLETATHSATRKMVLLK